MKKLAMLFSLCISLFAGNVLSAELMLPFQGGLTWRCDQGNNGTTSHFGNLQYSWDFNLGGGSDDLGYPVLAPAGGRVVHAGMTYVKKKDANGNYVLDTNGNYVMVPGPWGNVVIIDYGNNEFGKIAHLNEVIVNVGDSVPQGKTIGKCGGTNGYSPHIHYQTQNSDGVNGQSIGSSFIDAEELDRVPKKGGFYTSMNTHNPWNNFRIGKFANGWRIREFDVCFDFSFQPLSRPFLMTYAHLAGKDANGKFKDAYAEVGFPLNEVHQYPFPNQCFGNNPPVLWIQDVRTVDGSKIRTFVLNPFVSNLRMDYHDANGTKYWL